MIRNIEESSKLDKPKSTKINFSRQILGIKNQIDKRDQQRGITLYNILNGKQQSALIFGRQLLFTSSKVYKQFNDEYIEQFEQNFFYRTCKIKQYLEYLLDCLIICKIYIAAKKKQDLMELFQKIELMQLQEQRFKLQSEQQVIRYNQYHEIHAKTHALLLTFIKFAKSQKLNQYTQKFFRMYLNYTKKFYGSVQYATALFKYANHLYQIGYLPQAQNQYKRCLDIRGKNVLNQAYVDVLVNFAVCQRQLCNHKVAIQKLEFAIEVYKDINQQRERLTQLHLFLGKVYLENGDFQQAYKNLLITYKLRQSLSINDPSRVEIELNLLLMLKTLEDIEQDSEAVLNVKQRKEIQSKKKKAKEVEKKMKSQLLNRQDFSKYKQFKSSKMAHLVLTFTKEFYSALSSQQSQQLDHFMKRCTQISYFRGISDLNKCSFYAQKRIRNMLVQLNPHLRNA